MRCQWLRIERSVDLGFVLEVNEHVEPVRRPYLYELELDLAFLNKVVLFA
jgi:hypothetical protein